MSESGLLQALLEFQKEAPVLGRDSVNPHFRNKYVSLDAITQTITPLLCKHGLVWITLPAREDGEPSLRYRLAHAATGEVIEGSMPLMVAKNDPQGQGSALTYARRYAISSVLGLSAEDDDGHRASTPPKAASKSRAMGVAQPAPRSPDLVGAPEIKALQAAAKGLKAAQVKQAMASCNVTPPDPFVPASCFLRVPRDKAAVLVEALSSADVPWAGELPAADPVAPEVS